LGIFKRTNNKINETNNLRKDAEGHNEKNLTVEGIQYKRRGLIEDIKECDIGEGIIYSNHPEGLNEEYKKLMEEIRAEREKAEIELAKFTRLLNKKLNSKLSFWERIKNGF